MITRAKILAVRANSFVVVEQFTTFSQFRCHITFKEKKIAAAVLKLFYSVFPGYTEFLE